MYATKHCIIRTHKFYPVKEDVLEYKGYEDDEFWEKFFLWTTDETNSLIGYDYEIINDDNCERWRELSELVLETILATDLLRELEKDMPTKKINKLIPAKIIDVRGRL